MTWLNYDDRKTQSTEPSLFAHMKYGGVDERSDQKSGIYPHCACAFEE